MNKLEAEDGDNTITRSVYNQWEGHGIGVFKAMKISFVQRMALALKTAAEDNGAQDNC